MATTSGRVRKVSAMRCARFAVTGNAVPSGISITTENSGLLSSGIILTATHLEIEEGAGEGQGAPQHQPEIAALARVSISGVRMRRKKRFDPLGVTVLAQSQRL